MEGLLKIAVQTKGRLNEDSIKLIDEAGIKLPLSSRKLISAATNFPLEALFLRDDDIPQAVAMGVADIGIVGENEMLEKKENVVIAKRLGFSKCRLSLAIPKDDDYTGIGYFTGKKIATSYPEILKDFFKEKNINAEIHVITGSVEIAPGIGLADAIFDIVSSGSTLVSNRLKEVEVVVKSEAVLIANPNLSDVKKAILEELIFRMESVQRAEKKKYILLNAPNEKLAEIESYLPGMKSPTVMPLAEEGWSSVHSVIDEKDFWEIIGKLKAAGATGILVIPIEKMIF
jgi:ATP phosphoribosyltransferase